ncbi:endonuclease [Ketobacter sp. MCCC 1A13808]|uniref:endonuclease/exonuclease/phosphatase family protein n=1 Tax=Ketobacter sp. MCCC 1A13808 TaxID=2602738 RepID=UPI0012EB9696|nr:endonuclease/exonuclease/phosphatase family protein [Ketobacter sp. MCCC 1A13808]MVF12019.1 endonuclease [Ketobacter sp. MCCC 1A13808]
MLRLVTYNIHSGIGVDGIQSYRRIGEFLKQQQVDIALIQEMDTRPSQRDTDKDIEDLCAGHFSTLVPSPAIELEQGWYGNVILARFPVLFSHTLDVSQAGFQPRNVQEAVLQTERGALHVVNTHKGLNRLERRRQLALLDQHLRQTEISGQLPLLVGGDFNEWQFFSSAFRHINQVLHPHPVAASFPTRWPLFRLDRIWSRPANIVRNATVLKTPETRIYSDHYPVLAEIELLR